MVVPLSLLEDSSQFLRWRFTTEGLETRRASVNEIARQRVDVARKEEAVCPLQCWLVDADACTRAI